MRQEALLISAIVSAGNMRLATREGIDTKHFSTYKEEWDWVVKQKSVPSKSVFMAQFPDFRWRRVKSRDIPAIADSMRTYKTRVDFGKALENAARDIKKAKPQDLATTLRDNLSRIIQASDTTDVVEILAEGAQFVNDFRKRQKLTEKGQTAGIPTGMPTIDKHTGGYRDSQLYLIIARQGNAKTYFMLYTAAIAAIMGKKILWVSREMPEDMVTYRVHTIGSAYLQGADKAFSNLSLILGREDVNYQDYRQFVRKLRQRTQEGGRFFIPKNRGLGIAQLDSYIEQLGPDIVFYDYLGIISGQDDSRSAGWQVLGAQANMAKELAMKHHIPIVMASQVNRATKDNDEAPQVENISFADSIGYAADQVISLRLSSPDFNDPKATRFLEFFVRKNRYGLNDLNVTAKFNGDRGVLEEVEAPELDFPTDNDDIERIGKKAAGKRSSNSSRKANVHPERKLRGVREGRAKKDSGDRKGAVKGSKKS